MVPTDSPSPLAPLPHRCDRSNHHHPHSHTIIQPQLLQHRNNVPTTQSLRSVLATGCEFPIDHHHQCAPSSSLRYPTAGSSSAAAARPAPHFETSNCGRPQMAHEMYKRLLAVAERRHPKPMSFTPLEVRLAAFTGHRLAFREATSGGVATSLAVDFHTL